LLSKPNKWPQVRVAREDKIKLHEIATKERRSNPTMLGILIQNKYLELFSEPTDKKDT
jgi:hypothetical protein